jgi:hypothetical protein
MNALQKYEIEKRRQEAVEHQNVLLAIASIINTDEGRTLFSYLFKNFEVTTLPDKSFEGNMLHEYLGFLRAGNSIYKLACEAASEQAAQITAKLERKRYDDLLEQFRLENGFTDTNTSSTND